MQMSFTIIVLLSLTECAAVRLCPLGDTVTPLPRLTLVSLGRTVAPTPVVYLPCVKQSEPTPFYLPGPSQCCSVFYLYPHASAPLRSPRLRNWLSVVSLAVPLLLLSQNVSAVSRKCVCTLSVDHSVSVIQSSTEGLEEGSQLLDGSTPAVNYQIRARSSSQSAHLCH